MSRPSPLGDPPLGGRPLAASSAVVSDRAVSRLAPPGRRTPAGPPAVERVVAAETSLWYRLGDVWRYRELLLSLVRKELKVKYKNSALGFLWSMLNPALQLLVFWFVFQKVLKNGIPLFAIFMLCGLLIWNLFQAALPNSTTSIVDNAGIVKKVSFPREVLALAPVGAAIFFFALQVLVLVIAMLAFRVVPAVSYLPLLVPAFVGFIVFTSAVAIFLSAVNVYLRDTKHLVEVLLMAWFWATPVVYQYDLITEKLVSHHIPAWLPLLNPITPAVLVFQRALYGTAAPAVKGGRLDLLPLHAGPLWYLEPVGIALGVSVVLYVLALKVFIRLEGNFAEEM
jgi:ABC-2 type transport system permease protein